jgi:hypothetical protein
VMQEKSAMQHNRSWAAFTSYSNGSPSRLGACRHDVAAPPRSPSAARWLASSGRFRAGPDAGSSLGISARARARTIDRLRKPVAAAPSTDERLLRAS